jgi:hypothetical protein
MVDEIEAEVELVEMAPIQWGGDWGIPSEWSPSESMLWLSDHERSPSSWTAGSGESMARQ